MPSKARPAWTTAENERLRQLYPTIPPDDLVPLFPGRNAHSIRMHASQMKLVSARPKPGAWSDEHMAILREHYPDKGAAYVAALVGRSVGRVIGHASEYGIAFTGIRNPKRPLHGPKLPSKPVGRPKKAGAAPTKTAAPKVVTPAKEAIPAPPVKRMNSTPLLNARAAQKRQKEQEQAAKPKPFVTAQQIRDLRADHPARWAYTRAAIHGPAAASAAFYAAMQQTNG